MKRTLTLFVIITLLLATMVLFSAEPQNGGQNQQGGGQSYKLQSEIDYKPKKLENGYYSEIMYSNETWCFWPKNYSTVYIRPIAIGQMKSVSVITYRPKMLLYKGSLTHVGIKFTTLFPVVHTVYVGHNGTGFKLQVIYQPQANSHKMSQAERGKLCLQYAEKVDERYYQRVEKILEQRRKEKQERERQFRQDNNQNQ